ncbi:hypothetical protein [Pseudomonas alloputida]|uniref:hypothetical protein n=1 Tax=Pseudomonas TaxID=286 RepID=UPI003EEA6610
MTDDEGVMVARAEKGIRYWETYVYEGLVVLLCFLACVVAAGLLIGALAPQDIPAIPSDQMLVHARNGQPYSVAPEPVERLIYVVLAAFAPMLLVGYFLFSGRATAPGLHACVASPWVRASALVATLVLFVLPLVSSEYTRLLFFPFEWAKENQIGFFVLSMAVALAVTLMQRAGSNRRSRLAGMGWWVVVLVATALQIASYRLQAIGAVNLSPVWSVHVDAALYALNQVVHGKTLIADLPSQYGFFPEIIAPIFKVTGLSVFSMTAFFSLLQAIGLLALAVLIRRYINNGVLSLFVFLASSLSMGLFMYLNWHADDMYVQYFPIRFIMPVVALLLFSAYAHRPCWQLYGALAVLAGVAVFWNVDTGVPVLVSLCATLFVKALLRGNVREAAARAALFLFIAIGTLIGCFVLLRIKAGASLDLEEILISQKIFYMTGFGMLPMPVALDAWQVVIALYAAGMVAALYAWRNGADDPLCDVLLCTAVLGLGLFAYYQGRSHVSCLLLVSWPCIFIAGVLADRLLSAEGARGALLPIKTMAFPIVLFMSMGAVTFIAVSPSMALDAANNVTSLNAERDPTVADELAFMRSTYRGRDCLILTQRQAIYAAELNIASPLKGPGIAETLLQRDLDRLVRAALEQPLQCIYLGVAEGTITYVDVNDAALMARYPVITKNPAGTLMLLEPAAVAVQK